MRHELTRQWVVLAAIVGLGLGWSPGAFADEHVKGFITGNGPDGTILMQADDSRNLVVVLNDYTKVVREEKLLRRDTVSSAVLVPGLRIEVSGEYVGNDLFAAERVSFSKSNMKIARAVQAGITPTEQKLAATDQRLAATIRAVEATNVRISDLDRYDVITTVTVLFANGNAAIAPQYQAQLQQLAMKASQVPASVLEVRGYASAVGSGALNQRLSRQRADVVTAFLQQSGVPPTSIVAPAAMGISHQVATNQTAQGQAENRRAVVTLLQNRGIANYPE